MRLPIKRVVLLFCLLLLLIPIALTSCGTPSPTASMTLEVAQNSAAFSYFPLYIAEQQQLFKAQGLTVDPLPIPILGNGTKTAAALEANSIEVGIGTITDAFTLSRIDAYIKIIGAVSNAFLIDLLVSKPFLASTHLTEHSSLAEKVKALIGKKIGISAPGSATDAFLTYLFRQEGINDQQAVTKVNLGNVTPAAAPAALATGRVDAVSWPVPAGQEAAREGLGTIFISRVLGDVPAMRNMLYGVLYTKQQVIERKPKAVSAFIRALAQAERFIQKQPKQAALLLSKFLQLDQHTTDSVTQAALSSVPQSPYVSQEDYAVANDFHVKAGLIAVPLAYTDLVATETIKQALV